MKKRVAVLGATGSIGTSTLDILRTDKDKFQAVLFTANTSYRQLLTLKAEFPGAVTVLASGPEPGSQNQSPPEGIDFTGNEGLRKALAETRPDITVNGISGAAGLEPSVMAIRAGSDLALANKETIVMAGRYIFSLAQDNNVRIIPVDSEHSALFVLLEAHGRHNAAEIILTASGGPFRTYPKEKLAGVTPDEALAHPTWNMGAKITVDSATLANKGLEVIEAAALFGFPPEKIKVAVHPQSIVHSMIRLKDGAVYAQMSKPDMRLPIHTALSWPGPSVVSPESSARFRPDVEYSPFGILDLDALNLTFEKPDMERFPMLALAYETLKGPSPLLLPVVYNAANEIAVQAFLEKRIGFLEIPGIVEYALKRAGSGLPGESAGRDMETILARDREARLLAEEFIRRGAPDADL